MNMRPVLMIFPLLLTGGCATQPAAVRSTSAPEPSVVLPAATVTKSVETRYDVRGYRESVNPSLRHEAHAVFRRTRVLLTASSELETVPRETYPPASVRPLSGNEELVAELSTQRKITSELRSVQAALADAEEKMKAQYATLVRQSAEALKLREQLEADRERLRSGAAVEAPPAASPKPTTANTEVKW
jgi:hypothetical protein